MDNFIVFRKYMIEALDFIGGKEREDFIRNQWKLLRAGIRDVRIHDAACVAWPLCGGSV